jgi:hypothetical protein
VLPRHKKWFLAVVDDDEEGDLTSLPTRDGVPQSVVEVP